MLTPSVSSVSSNLRRLQIDFGKVFLLKEINNHTYIVLDISHSENTSSTIGQKQHGYLKLWYFSGKMFATLVLIIFPTLVLVSQVAFEEMRLYFIKGLENGSLTIQYVNSNIYIYYIIIYFQYSVFLITLVVFPPFPAPHSTEKYFRIRGFENAVLEYEFVRHILLVTLVPPYYYFGLYYYSSIYTLVFSAPLKYTLKSEYIERTRNWARSASAAHYLLSKVLFVYYCGRRIS